MSASSAKRNTSATPRRLEQTPRPPQTSGFAATKSLSRAVRAGKEEFTALTGRTPESVTGARALENGDGWSILVDVVELDRIPASTSVLATYRVDLDDEGSITSYERLRRYSRGATDRG